MSTQPLLPDSPSLQDLSTTAYSFSHSLDVWITRRRPAILAALAALFIAYSVRSIIDFAVVTIDGTQYFLVDDDVMISMRYGRNLAYGAGLVYNAGERVEGFSTPLLTFLAALLHLLPV